MKRGNNNIDTTLINRVLKKGVKMMIVAADGSGDYLTVEQALKSVSNTDNRVAIYIKTESIEKKSILIGLMSPWWVRM